MWVLFHLKYTGTFLIRGKQVCQKKKKKETKGLVNHLGCSVVCAGVGYPYSARRDNPHKTHMGFRTMGLLALMQNQQQCVVLGSL